MVYNKLPNNTPQILRDHGLKVVEVDGWKDRGRPASTGNLNPVGVLCHHTATRKSNSDDAVLRLLRVGRSDLPGPLCHFGLGRDGTVYIVAAGRANHAGVAKSSGTVAKGDGNSLYWGIEAFNDGVGEPWPDVQYDAYVLLCAVLSKYFTGNSVNTVRGHKETSVTGKIDPTFNMDKFRDAVKAKMDELGKPAKAPVTKPKPTPTPVPKSDYKDFIVHLVPGKKIQTHAGVVADMKRALDLTEGGSAIVVNTERESDTLRNAVATGLGEKFTRVFDNENTMAYGPNWHKTEKAEATLLAADDPGKAGVSPNRYLNRLAVEDKRLPGHTILFKGLHLVSEANCKHVNVRGRAWREKTWKKQVDDVLDSLEADHKAGYAQVVAGDWNTGIKFTGDELFRLLKANFGNDVHHVFNGKLDHIFIISGDDIKLAEVGVEKRINNRSDHDMISAKIRATVR